MLHGPSSHLIHASQSKDRVRAEQTSEAVASALMAAGEVAKRAERERTDAHFASRKPLTASFAAVLLPSFRPA